MALLDDKVVVITGAGSGIAKASTSVFVREGAKVLAVDISGAEEDTATELGDAVVPFRADVSKEEDVEKMIAAAVATFGRLDSLLNVAGTQAGRSSPEVTMAGFDEMMAVNLRGVLLCMKYGIRAMLDNGGGSIVNFSSVGALNAEERAPIVYMAAKAGVHAVTKAAAVEFGA